MFSLEFIRPNINAAFFIVNTMGKFKNAKNRDKNKQWSSAANGRSVCLTTANVSVTLTLTFDPSS